MRIFRGVGEMLKEVERELFEMGITNFTNTMQDKNVKDDPLLSETKELMGYSYGLTSWEDKERMFETCREPLKQEGLSYSQREFKDRINPYPFNPGLSWHLRKEIWEKFLEPGGIFSYTYSERMNEQLNKIIYELQKNPGSRQCVLTIYDYHLDLSSIGGKRRIPCSMYYQFLRRRINDVDCLSLIYTMRSCDFYTHFPIDTYLALSLLEFVAMMTSTKPFFFTHLMGSLHAYAKDFKGRRIF